MITGGSGGAASATKTCADTAAAKASERARRSGLWGTARLPRAACRTDATTFQAPRPGLRRALADRAPDARGAPVSATMADISLKSRPMRSTSRQQSKFVPAILLGCICSTSAAKSRLSVEVPRSASSTALRMKASASRSVSAVRTTFSSLPQPVRPSVESPDRPFLSGAGAIFLKAHQSSAPLRPTAVSLGAAIAGYALRVSHKDHHRDTEHTEITLRVLCVSVEF